LVSVNLSEFIRAAVLRSAALCIRLRNISRKWFVTKVLTLLTYVLQPHTILCGLSVMIQKLSIRVL